MKRLIISLIVLSIVFFVTDFTLAGDSVSIAVSCTIPAIPGVNVPLGSSPQEPAEKNTVRQETEEKHRDQYLEVKDKKEEELSLFIVQEDVREEPRLTQASNLSEAVKTIYSR